MKRPRSASRPVIGFVGRLVPDKGVEDLVTAFEKVTRVIPDARLLLISSVDETDPLSATAMAAIDTDPRITLTGYVSDVSPYFEQMDVLALPSFREGLPTVLLEAAAHGLPTVASSATGSRDGFLAGRTGWAVSAGNSGEIANALLECLTNPDEADARGRAGRAWVSANFAREIVWESWNHVYHDALEMRIRSQAPV